MRIIICTFVLFATGAAMSFSQQADRAILIPEKSTMHTYETMMQEWSHHSPDIGEKGWKWLGRWIHDQERLSMPGGLPTSQKKILSGLEEFEAIQRKQSVEQINRVAPWSPGGPFSAPFPIDSLLVPGTGRINCITFHPTDKNTMWCGGGQGGIFKSTNGGLSWFPIGDNLRVMHVSDIAVDPNDPDVMYVCVGDYAYVGTGLYLDDRKRHTHYGLGIYKTIDGGLNWVPTGLTFQQNQEDGTLMRRVIIDENNSNILIAAGISGIWQSFDAGEQWMKVEDEVIWDIEQDPTQPKIIYASTGFIPTRYIGKAGLLKSIDFGQTWEPLPISIPAVDSVTRIEIAISRSNPNYVYALTANLYGGFAGLHRSTNGGSSWEVQSVFPNILHWNTGSFSSSGQGWYDLAILVDPINEDKIYTGGVNTWLSEDGGQTWNGASYYYGVYGGISVHADHHQLQYNPLDEYIYLCHDGGVSRTKEIQGGDWTLALSDPDYRWPTQWEHLNEGLANLSFYRLGVSQSSPGNLFAGAQDMGTFLKNGENWTYHSLGDGMECVIHPENDQIIYGSSQYGRIFRSMDGGFSSTSLGGIPSPWEEEFTGWTTPYSLLPGRPEEILLGASNMWYSLDEGASFQKISNFQNATPISHFAFCESDPDVIYVGKRLYWSWGQLSEMYHTADGGNTWNNITAGLPDSLFFSYIDVDDDNPLSAWVTCSGLSEGRKVYHTANGGQTWENISGSLPNLPANCVLHQTGSLTNIVYVGMDRGVYYKTDEMDDWVLMSEGLPNVVVSEMEILWNGDFDVPELYISTFGRGIWKTNALSDATVSIKKTKSKQWIAQITPNVNKGEFSLTISGMETTTDIRVEIVDGLGRIIEKAAFHAEPSFTNQHFTLNTLSGQYFARIMIDRQLDVIPFMIVD
jgi:photosystem II stability/assembly factor-like uncharacterized protein